MNKRFVAHEGLYRKLRWRRRLCRVIMLGRHWWDSEWTDVDIRNLEGLTDEEIEQDVGFQTVGRFRLCRICYADQHEDHSNEG